MRNVKQARSGAALPMVLLVMFVLVGGLAAGFSMLSSESIADGATIRAQGAAALAESGLQQGLRNRAGLSLPAIPSAAESTRVVLPGGYADIVTTRMRAALGTTIPSLYLVRARGVRTGGGTGPAIAMATAFANFTNVTMTIGASITGINGIKKTGNSGSISGVDQCGVAPSVAAVSVPTTPGYNGQLGPLTGTPQVSIIGATAADAATTVPFDWQDILAGTAISANYTVTSNGVGFPPQSYFTSDTTRFPTIIVNNGPFPNIEYTLPYFGRGLLIVYGDLRLNGSTAGWDGVLLVGGKITSNGTNRVSGAVVTGLNVKAGFAVTNNDVDDLNGTKQFLYNSCKVASALTSLGSLRVFQNSWANSFPAY